MKDLAIYNSKNNKVLCTLTVQQFNFLCRSMGFVLLNLEDYEYFINSGKVKSYLIQELENYIDDTVNMGLFDEEDILNTVKCLKDISEESAQELYKAVYEAQRLINMVYPVSSSVGNPSFSNSRRQSSIRNLYNKRKDEIRNRLLLSIVSQK